MSHLAFDASNYDAAPAIPITNYSGSSGTSPTTITSNGHGLSSGGTITISGYSGFSAYNNSFEVIVLDANQFTIDTSREDVVSPYVGIGATWEIADNFKLSADGEMDFGDLDGGRARFGATLGF